MRHEAFACSESLNGCYSALGDVFRRAEIPPKIFHYTSAEVLDKILSNACFRATNLYYLNDSKEYLQGLNDLMAAANATAEKNPVIEECIDELRHSGCNTWEGLYTISFSTEGDNLQHWITYAKESGVCIQLDSDIMARRSLGGDTHGEQRLLLLQKGAKGTPVGSISCGNSLNPIAYNDHLKLDELENAFINYHNSNYGNASAEPEQESFWRENKPALKRFLQLAASFRKTKDFSGEHEVRLSFFPLAEAPDDVSDAPEEVEIKYHCMPSGALRPYIDIFFFSVPERTYGCPIRSITIGPGGHQQVVFDSTIHRLKYGNCRLWNFGPRKKAEFLDEYINLCSAFAQNLLIDNYATPDTSHQIIEELMNYLREEWAYRAGYHVTVDDTGRCSLEKREKTSCPSLGDNAILKRVLSQVFNNYYLSVEGILVKKSDCSYIF